MKKFLTVSMLIIAAVSGFSDNDLSKEDIVGKLESIFQIPDDSNRLESYDQFAASLGIVTKPGAEGGDGTTENRSVRYPRIEG